MTNKIALVTGASRGIGAATALALARAGCDVAINYRSSESAANAVAAQVNELGRETLIIQADVSEAQAVEAMVNAVVARWGRLDVLVNNAGILQQQCSLERLSYQRFERMLQVNTLGPFLCCRAALPHMQSGASIVNVSSVAAKTGAPGEYVDYAASKGAIDTLTIGLAAEVARRGIRVNAVRPGFIKTDIHADGGEPDRPNRIGPNLPLGRPGEVEDVAEAICWLALEKSSFTTGQFIDVAGGK